MKFGITGSKLRKKLLSSLAILSLSFTGLVALSAPASAAGQEQITFDSSQYVTDNGAAGFFKVIADSNGVSGYGHAEWAPWATGSALNADPTLVDWISAGVPWNHGWKVKTDVGNANNVLYIQRPETSELNSGITLLDRTDNQTIISTGNMVVTAKVKALADASVTVTMKLINTSGGAITQSATTSAVANTWSTLTFDFTTPASGTFDSSKAYKKLDLMFDPANAKAGQGHEDWGQYEPATSATHSKLYFLDDVSYTLAAAPEGGGGSPVAVAHRLVTAGSTGLIGTPFDKGAQDWFQYYSAGVKYYTAVAEVGTAVTLKWHVTNTAGAAFANQAVNLIVGKSYAGSNASFSTTYSGHASFNTTGSGGSDARTISGTTDANGDVSWTLTNTDVTGQTRPEDLNAGFANGGLFAQIALLLPGGSQGAENQDIIDLHFVAKPVPVAHRLVTAGSTGLIGTPFDKGAQDWFQYYSAGVKYYTAVAEVGTAVTLKWHVTNTAGAAFANQAVNLIVGKSYAGSNASFSTTYSGHASFNTTGSGGSDARTISGTTDANGDVSWTLTNTDVTGQTRPEDLNAGFANGGLFAQIALLLPGGSQGAENQDIIDLHFVAAAEGGGDGGGESGSETITFDSSQYVTDNGAAGFFKVIADSNGVSGYGHAEWAPWATGSALNADPTLVDWISAGVPWNHGWKVKTDVGNANNVLYIQRPETSELNSGITLLDRTDNQTIISTGNMVVTAKVKALADASVTVTMKLTNTSGGAITQSATTSAVANTWSTLTFDFTTPASGTFDSSKAYKKLDLMFDPANAKAGQGHEDWGQYEPATSATHSKLYFLDDVSYTLAAAPEGGGGSPVAVAHRLVTAGSTGLIGTPFDKGAQDWFQYYSAGVKYYTAVAEVGTAVTLKWHVTNTAGAAFANQAVNLIVGKSYAGSNASFSTTYSGHASFNTTGSGGSDARTISGTTDANGDVSWTLTNTDVTGQTRPEDLNAGFANGGLFAQIALLLPGGSQGAENQDIIDLHFVAAAGGGGGTPTVPVAHRLVTAGSTGLIGTPFDKGSKDWFQYYSAGVKYYTAVAEVGTAVTLKWHVTNTAGAAFANQAVNLIVGKSYSVSTASFSTTYSGHTSFSTPGHGTNDAETIPGTTDANGDVSWTLTNIDVTGETRPADLNGDVPNGGLFAQIALLLPGGSQGAEDQDIIDLHFVKAANYVAPVAVLVKTKMISTPTLSYDLSAKTLTCSNLTASGKISDAAYFLFINNKLIGGKVAGTTKGLNYGYNGVTLSTSGATLDSATWTIAASWNTNNIARARCLVKSFVTNAETIVAATSTVSVPRIGKYMPRSKKGATAPTTAVTMRLVEPALVKDAAGKASNYFDWSYNALENDWAKYYGPKLAFIYKYINAGSTTTFKWHVTDTDTGAALTSFPVSLIVNKNYGGVENATFTYEMNGATKEIAASPSNGGTGETKIAGMTDENGDVSFTITNTNSAATAEPTPAALNEMQPATAVNLHSQITLTAGLDQTKESIDLLEIHVVKP